MARLAAFGLRPEDFAGTAVWPENWPAFCLFFDMRTQWRTGMAGPTGLDYAVLFQLMDLHEIPKDERQQMLADVRVMESAALSAIHPEPSGQ